MPRTWQTRLVGQPDRGAADRFTHPMRPTEPSTDVGLTIAIAEIDGIREFLIMNNSHVANRFNYHLVLISAAFAGSAALFGAGRMPESVALVGAVATTVLTLGLLTFARIARADVTREEFITMINLYRGYLMTRAPELATYNILPVQTIGEVRQWRVQSALRNLALTSAIINAATAGAAAVTLSLALARLSVPHLAGMWLLGFSIAFLGQSLWLKAVYAHGRANIQKMVGVSHRSKRQ
jgi:hypothetical protein